MSTAKLPDSLPALRFGHAMVLLPPPEADLRGDAFTRRRTEPNRALTAERTPQPTTPAGEVWTSAFPMGSMWASSAGFGPHVIGTAQYGPVCWVVWDPWLALVSQSRGPDSLFRFRRAHWRRQGDRFCSTDEA